MSKTLAQVAQDILEVAEDIATPGPMMPPAVAKLIIAAGDLAKIDKERPR